MPNKNTSSHDEALPVRNLAFSFRLLWIPITDVALSMRFLLVVQVVVMLVLLFLFFLSSTTTISRGRPHRCDNRDRCFFAILGLV